MSEMKLAICFLITIFLTTNISYSAIRVRRQGITFQDFDSPNVNRRPSVNNNNPLPQPNNQGFQQRPWQSTTTAAFETTTTQPRQLRQCLNSCLSTNEYNPVCGSNGVTYSNDGKLRCAIRCGTNVSKMRNGSCSPATK